METGGVASPAFDLAAADALLGERRTVDELDDLFRRMKKVLVERVLAGELTHHLGCGRGYAEPAGRTNHRNGARPKIVLTDDGVVPLAVPRDRDGGFTPQLIPTGARGLPRFDQNVLSLYARGRSVRKIKEQIEELYLVARPDRYNHR